MLSPENLKAIVAAVLETAPLKWVQAQMQASLAPAAPAAGKPQPSAEPEKYRRPAPGLAVPAGRPAARPAAYPLAPLQIPVPTARQIADEIRDTIHYSREAGQPIEYDMARELVHSHYLRGAVRSQYHKPRDRRLYELEDQHEELNRQLYSLEQSRPLNADRRERLLAVAASNPGISFEAAVEKIDGPAPRAATPEAMREAIVKYATNHSCDYDTARRAVAG